MFGSKVLRLKCLVRNACYSEWRKIFLTRFQWVHFFRKDMSLFQMEHYHWTTSSQSHVRYDITQKTGLALNASFSRVISSNLDRSIQNRSTDLEDWRFIFSYINTCRPTLRNFYHFFLIQSSHSKLKYVLDHISIINRQSSNLQPFIFKLQPLIFKPSNGYPESRRKPRTIRAVFLSGYCVFLPCSWDQEQQPLP